MLSRILLILTLTTLVANADEITPPIERDLATFDASATNILENPEANIETTPDISKESLPTSIKTTSYPTKRRIYLNNSFYFDIIDEDKHPLNHNLNDLSPEDYRLFQEKRFERLSLIAKLISFGKLKTGIGYAENDNITLVSDGENLNHPLYGLDLESNNSREPHNKKIKQNQFNLLNAVLTKIDNHIFEKSKSFVGGKEYCLDIYLAPMSVVGFGKYIYGGSYGINLIIGFDKLTKTMSFQIKKTHEMPRIGFTFIPLGINARIGMFTRSSTYAPQTYTVDYTPGAPLYSIRSNGANGGGLSVPISLLGVLTFGAFTVAETFMTYSGPNHTVTLVDSKFKISFHSFKEATKQRASSTIQNIKSTLDKMFYRSHPIKTCSGLFF